MRNVICLLAICVFNLGLAGCAVTSELSNWIIEDNPTLPLEVVDYPPLNEETRGTLGRTLAARGVKSDRPAIKLLEDWVFGEGSFGNAGLIMRSGKGPLEFRATDRRTNDKWDCFAFRWYREEHWNNTSFPPQPNEGDMHLCKNSESKFLAWWGRPIYAEFDARYEEMTIEEQNGPTNVQEFIYNGRVGDAVKFVYREFKNSYARPAFTQEVQYDLSHSDEIGFQDLRIKVIDATNTDITYTVIRNF